MAIVKTVLILVLIFIVCRKAKTEGCQTPRDEQGECIRISDCQVLTAMLRQKPLKAEDINYLRRSQCGIEGGLPKVCCPVQRISFSAPPLEDDADACQTSKKEKGECKIISKCQFFMSILQNKPVKPEDQDYLRRSQCGSDGLIPKICCPLQVKPVSSSLLPSFDICGSDMQNKIYGGTEAGLGEFPWMVMLEYEDKDDGKRRFCCGGALINNRYVLTAAHCLLGKHMEHLKLISVRLGEHNTDTNPDCIELDDKKFCVPAPIDIPIEKWIAHESYNWRDSNQYRDIGLVRLSREIQYTDSVKPICLPTTAYIQNMSLAGKKLIVAGWGKTENTSLSSVKLKLEVPFKSNTNCVTSYANVGINLTDSQLCAGGERGKDSCSGDSGGPLMRLFMNENGELNYYAIGVVSFGPARCGIDKWPGVYTKVDHYVQWIVDKLRP